MGKKGRKPSLASGGTTARERLPQKLVSSGEVVAQDAAGLVLVRRSPSDRSEWAFPERAANAPPLASTRESLATISAAGRLAGADPERYWWWITDEALDGIGCELSTAGFCVIDGLLGTSAARALRDEVSSLNASGRLQSSKLAGGRSGSMLSYTHAAVRGDCVGWFDGDEADMWPRRTLTHYLQRVDTLVAELGSHVPHLAGVSSRSKAMVACYPGGGARYVRHCDNSCDHGSGERCNGRRLTALIYLNETWAPLDGGELRLYAPYAPKGRPAIADVRPLLDRLVLFWADYRVPHEVLPSHAERLAITLWYFDKEEYGRARQAGTAADQTDAQETEAIEAEIAKFEQRFGGVAVRHE